MDEKVEVIVPIVEMTREQKDMWDECLSEEGAKDDFIYFIDFLDTSDMYINLFDELFTEFRSNSRVLMNAWLHPESIKVVN